MYVCADESKRTKREVNFEMIHLFCSMCLVGLSVILEAGNLIRHDTAPTERT